MNSIRFPALYILSLAWKVIRSAVLEALVPVALVVVVAEAPEALAEALVVLVPMASAQKSHKTVTEVPQAVL